MTWLALQITVVMLEEGMLMLFSTVMGFSC